MLAFNFFFLPPVHTLTIADSSNWFALGVFVVTSIVVSGLAARSRRRAEEAAAHAEAATALLEERERLAQEALEAEALRRGGGIKTALPPTGSPPLRHPLLAVSASPGAPPPPVPRVGGAPRRVPWLPRPASSTSSGTSLICRVCKPVPRCPSRSCAIWTTWCSGRSTSSATKAAAWTSRYPTSRRPFASMLNRSSGC